MASHHCHPHYHHQPPPPPPPCCCRQCHPQPPPSDPHLESALARLLHPAPPPPQPQFSRHRRIQQPSVLVSLIDRIEALESSLYSLSISPPASSSLRDAAARVIQAHFRVFLARRSKTLRHLKELASVKSRFTVLRSSLSGVSRLNLVSLSERAMDLLLKLDSIQDNDPMIRDGKRSISRDLDAFLNCIDAIAVKRHHLSVSSRVAAKSQPSSSRSCQSRILRQEKQIVDNLRSRVDRIRSLSNVYKNDEEEEEEGEEDEEEEEDVELESFENFSDDDNNPRNKIEGFARPPQPRVKKNVTFAENGNVYKIISSKKPNLSSSSEDGSSSCIDGDVSDADISEKSKGSSSYLHKKDYQEAEIDNSHNNVASPASSDGGVPSSWLRNEPKINIVRESPDQGVDFMFSAPLTDKIETREDLMKRRKSLKISGQ